MQDSENLRSSFEKWLQEVHLLSGTWDSSRNCYQEYPCHLAYKAWKEAFTVCQKGYTEGVADERERWQQFIRDNMPTKRSNDYETGAGEALDSLLHDAPIGPAPAI